MDYDELMDETGLNFTTEEYEAIKRVFIGADVFKSKGDVVRFFKKNGKEQGMETVKSIDYREILAEREGYDRTVTALNKELERTTNNLHEKERLFIDSRREAKELGEMFAKEKEAKDAEIRRLNNILNAYRKVVDLSRFTQDELVIALANGGVRL